MVITSIAAWQASILTALHHYMRQTTAGRWGNSYQWDQGAVFACRTQPHIFGYWGEVLFPALSLPVLVDRIDDGPLA